MKAKIHTDAGLKDGMVRIGYIIQRDEQPIAWAGMETDETGINTGEYLALIAALRHAIRLGFKQAEVLSDSELMVNQIAGKFRVKSAVITRVHREVRELIKFFTQGFQIRHIDREQNTLADGMAKEIAYFEPELGPPDPSHGRGGGTRPLLGWQAALIRGIWKPGMNMNVAGRAFGVQANTIKQIIEERSYADAVYVYPPPWEPNPRTAEAFASPTVFTTFDLGALQNATDSQEAAEKTKSGPVRGDVRQRLPAVDKRKRSVGWGLRRK